MRSFRSQTRPAVGGWTALGDAQIEASGGALVLTTTGADPGVVTRQGVTEAGPYVLDVRMRSTASGQAQAFWATKAAPGFARARCTFFDVVHDGQWHDYRVELPCQGAATSFRLDPCTGAGRVQIARMRVLLKDGRIGREWAW